MKADENTIYVLSLPGGGTRGYLSNKFLKKFMERWQLSRLDPLGAVWENFDVIGGTSTGGIAAIAYGIDKSVDEVVDIYTRQAPWIFTDRDGNECTGTTTTGLPCNPSCDAAAPSVKAELASFSDLIDLVASNRQLYKSECANSNYGHARLKSQLQFNYQVNVNWPEGGHTGSVRDATMQDMLTNVVVPVYCNSTGKPATMSNINGFEYEGQNELAYEIAMCTSAAPVYLPPYVMGGREYIDGGIFSNSASQTAITAGHFVKKKANRVCILEATTGISLNPHTSSDLPLLGAGKVIVDFIQDSIGAVQANTARDLRIRSRYNTEQLHYYSFAPIFSPPEGLTTALDDTTPETFAYYDSLVNAAFVSGSSELTLIDQFITRLNFGIPTDRLIPLP